MIGLSMPLSRRRLIYLRDLVRELVMRDLKLRYRRSILGIAWSLVTPLAQLLVFTFLFHSVLRLEIPNYPVFVFSGLLAWSWFQSSVLTAASVIVDSRELIRRPGFPSAMLPAVTVTAQLIHFLLALPILLFIFLLGGGQIHPTLLILPLLLALEFALTLGLAYLAAAWHVRFRDTQHLLGIAMLLLFYLTPVFYDSSAIPSHYQALYNLNPLVHLLAAYRGILLWGTLPAPLPLAGLAALAGSLLALGYCVFTRASVAFAEEL